MQVRDKDENIAALKEQRTAKKVKVRIPVFLFGLL